MNVCFVSPGYYTNTVGGAEVQLYMMAKGLARLPSYDVSYLTMDRIEHDDDNGVQVVTVPGDMTSRSCSFDDFARSLDSVSPNAVVQLGRKQFTIHARRYCSFRRIPFLFSAASDIDCRRLREVPRYFGEYSLKKALNPVRLARSYLRDRRTFSAMGGADVLIAQTESQQDKLRRLCGKEVVLFQNLHEVPSKGSIVKETPPLVLWLASIKAVKRPRLFLEVCKRLHGRGYRIVMAGRMNDEQFRSDIQKLVERGCVEYIEHVGFEESNDWIARASVFVLTSRHEGLPNTLIQAWLRRTPTVSLGVDPDNMITENGLGARVDSVEQAADAIAGLLEDSREWSRAADSARAFSEEKFGMDSQIHRLDEILRRAMHDA